MTANATRRSVPMAGTGDGPRPDTTTFASTARTDGGRRATTNRTAADDSTQ
jgi:hypothetical protein